MIAHRRADVAELNGRARAVMRATGQLGAQELVADAAFAAGDRVLVKRNDSRCDVRNGDRGVIDRVDQGQGSLHVRFDERTVVLDARFLSQPTQTGRPALEHGYAITAYAAQGMTCRHALVLARDDAYREWIYTTMTRASEANRLYVVGERQRGRDREELRRPNRPPTAACCWQQRSRDLTRTSSRWIDYCRRPTPNARLAELCRPGSDQPASDMRPINDGCRSDGSSPSSPAR
jgi:hypothetical protein